MINGLEAMNFQPALPPVQHAVTAPVRPPQAQPAQETARPVPPAAHPEAAGTQPHRETAARERRAATGGGEQSPARGRELSDEEKREVEQLKARDREVRQHEAAHKNAAGQYARGGVSFTYETGPDGRRYAIGGEVDIDTGKVPNDPQATLEKARTIRRAALAPAEPSPADRQIAAEASRMEQQALREINAARTERIRETGSPGTTQSSGGEPQPAAEPVGRLLDVFA